MNSPKVGSVFIHVRARIVEMCPLVTAALRSLSSSSQPPSPLPSHSLKAKPSLGWISLWPLTSQTCPGMTLSQHWKPLDSNNELYQVLPWKPSTLPKLEPIKLHFARKEMLRSHRERSCFVKRKYTQSLHHYQSRMPWHFLISHPLS